MNADTVCERGWARIAGTTVYLTVFTDYRPCHDGKTGPRTHVKRLTRRPKHIGREIRDSFDYRTLAPGVWHEILPRGAA